MHCSPEVLTNRNVSKTQWGLIFTRRHKFPTWAGTKSFSLYLTGSNGLPLPNIARPCTYTYNLIRHVCLDNLFQKLHEIIISRTQPDSMNMPAQQYIQLSMLGWIEREWLVSAFYWNDLSVISVITKAGWQYSVLLRWIDVDDACVTLLIEDMASITSLVKLWPTPADPMSAVGLISWKRK